MIGAAARILVIKLGALGDFVQALGPMQAIRRYHRDARITLLTTAPYRDLAKAAGVADEIWIDERRSLCAVGHWLALRRRLRAGGFDRVYDLQTSDRSGWYFRLFWPGPWPEWSGIAAGSSHPHDNPMRNRMHTIERQADQLRRAGIDDVRPADMAWAFSAASAQAVAHLDLPRPYALLVPGGSQHRTGKRWPLTHYAALAKILAARGLTPVVLGMGAEQPLAHALAAAVPETRDLTGRTRLIDIPALARAAACAVGNDTGPMHLIAAAGCPSVVLFSHASDPALCAPRGERVTVLRSARLEALPVEEVAAALPPVV